ncbi:MerR family transcriptional regulator [bacterium]|nr:MAG: MerR family transcriptional regulator [bacterium]
MSEYPSKLYYSISEVAEITGIKAHVLRYWESEFPTFRPRKTRAGARRYRQKDIDEIEAIKRLLYEEGFKIAGARKQLREMHRGGGAKKSVAAPQMKITFDGLNDAERLAKVKESLQDILEMVRALKAQEAPAGRKPKARRAKG